MVLIIIYAQLLLLCARGAEPKIVYSRPVRNDTTMTATTATTSAEESSSAAAAAVEAEAEADDDETTTVVAAAAEDALAGRRYADNSKSMSSKTNYYGVQFYTPPIVHGAVDMFGRQLHQRHHLNHQHPAAYRHHMHRRPMPWGEPTAAMVQDTAGGGGGGGGGAILMNPLQVAAYDDLSTARYAPPSFKPRPPPPPPPPPPQPQPQQRPQSVARLIKYTEPAAVAYQLPFLAAETVDRTLLDNLPALQFALQHAATGKPPPPQPPTAQVVTPAQYALHQHQQQQQQQQQHHHHHHQQQQPHQVVKPPLHQLYPPPPPPHHHQRLPPQPLPMPSHPHHLLHHAPPHHRYAAYGGGTQPHRYTQVPFLYNLPAPPHAHRPLAPSEYDLVTRFNRLLKERERDDDSGLRRRRPDDATAEEEDDDEVETTTRPPAKAKKAKKTKKKKRRPPTTPAPAPVEDDAEEEEDRDKQQQQQQQEDQRAEDEQPNSEEQESQFVHTSERLPEGTMVHETEADMQNEVDGPTQLSEQFGGDLTFEDGGGERVEFQLHGLGGPDSYKFGFDTGKGTNRQFRYEERDSSGNVHGHYGYLDNDGKMQVYNYSSHPEYGFHAEKAETPPAEA